MWFSTHTIALLLLVFIGSSNSSYHENDDPPITVVSTMVTVSDGVEDILGPACRRNCGDCDDEGEDPRFTAKYAYLLVHDAECFDLAYEAYDRAMMMVTKSTTMTIPNKRLSLMTLKLLYAQAKIVHVDNTKDDFRDTIETGTRMMTEVFDEIVELEKKYKSITKKQRDEILRQTCVFDIHYFAAGQSMGFCSAFAKIAPYSATARGGTALIDGYWVGDVKYAQKHMTSLVEEICVDSAKRYPECDTHQVILIAKMLKNAQIIYEYEIQMYLSGRFDLSQAITSNFTLWKRVDIYTGVPVYTILNMFSSTRKEDHTQAIFKASEFLKIKTEPGSFSTLVKSSTHENHAVQINILRSSLCSTWHRMRQFCRVMAVISVRGRDVIFQSESNTFHWLASGAKGYFDFAEAIVRSMERTLSKRQEKGGAEKAIFWDIACGTGWMSQYVAASLLTSLSRIVATDIDPNAVRIAKGLSKMNGFEDLIEVKQGSKLEPFQNESPADFIFMYPPQMGHNTATRKGARFSSNPLSLFLDEDQTELAGFFETVIDHIQDILRPGGKLFLGIDHKHVEHVISHAALNVKNGLHNGLRVHVICGQLHWDPATHVYREPSSLIEIERAEACEGGEYVPGTLC